MSALMLTACHGEPEVVALREGLTSCEIAADCPLSIGACAAVACISNVCVISCSNACADPADCNDGNPCTEDDCVATACVHTPLGINGSDGGLPAGCCFDSLDCTAPATCQTAPTCEAGSCTYRSNDLNDTCCDGRSECGGMAICTLNQCACDSGEKFCVGMTAGNGRCVPTAGCCVDADCPSRANTAKTCSLAGSCVYTCSVGFGNCNSDIALDGCETDTTTSLSHCGQCMSACPSGSECEAPLCAASLCGFASTGGSGCCNAPGDCATPGVCQVVDCELHTCSYSAKQVSGCCATTDDCPATDDPCVLPTCLDNICGTTVDVGCVLDGSMPADLSTTPSDGGAADASPNDGSAPDAAVAPVTLTDLTIAGGGGCQTARGGLSVDAWAFALGLVALGGFRARRRRARSDG